MIQRTLGTISAGLLVLLATPNTALAQDGAPAAEPATSSCIFTNSTSTAMDAVLRERGVTIDDYDAFCTRLVAANMGVDVSEFARVGAGHASAIVTVRLFDLASQVRGQESSYATITFPLEAADEAAPENAANDALEGAYNAALANLASQFDANAASLTQEVARLDYFFATPPPPVPVREGECTFTNVATPELRATINNRGGFPDFPNFDSLCAALRERNAGLNIAGGANIEDAGMLTWSTISLFDRASGINSSGEVNALGIANSRDETRREEAMHAALGFALQTLADDQQNMLASLDEVTNAHAAFFAPGQ